MPEERERGGGEGGGGRGGGGGGGGGGGDVGNREGANLLRRAQEEVGAERGAFDRHIPISRQVEKIHEESDAERVLGQGTGGVPDLNFPRGLFPEKVFPPRSLCMHGDWGLGFRV